MGRRPSRIECGRFLYKIERFYLVSLEMEDWKMVLSSKPVRVTYFFFPPFIEEEVKHMLAIYTGM